MGGVLRADLGRIGIKLSIVHSDGCPTRYGKTTERADLLTVAYGGNTLELDPKPFFDEVLTTGLYGSALGPGPWSTLSFRKRVELGNADGQPRIKKRSVLSTTS